MTEETATPAPAEVEAPPAPKESPAPSATPDAHMIPKTRFDEVNAARDKAEKELKKFQDAEQKRVEAQMTKEQLLEKQNAEYKAKADKATAEAEAKLLKAAFLLKAQSMGFENPEDAFVLANKNVTRKEDGDYDAASIEAALKPSISK